MAFGKNKRISKKGKGGKKKVADPMTKKEWYDIKAPNPFDRRIVGKTLCTRTTGTSNLINYAPNLPLFLRNCQ